MESNIPGFGAREIIGLAVTLVAIVGFLISLIKLTFSKSKDTVQTGYNPSGHGFHLITKNFSIVTLIVSAVLLATMGTVVFASPIKGWVYLGPGYGNYRWNFLTVEDDKNFKAGDVVVAQNKVNVREAHFGNFTQTWLGFLSPSEPEVINHLKKGDCVKVLGFESVGFNKVWMKISSTKCPVAGDG